VPARSGSARARELQALRAALQRAPRDVEAAVNLARRYVDEALAEGDPRFVGHAQAALAPWWDEPAPPVPVRVLRAVLRQYDHRFDEALVDLGAAVSAEPDNAEAWSWMAAVHMVRADYPAARRACEGLAPLTTPLLGTACSAYVDSMSSRADEAARELDAALAASPEASAPERLWALTRLAEIQERRGDRAAAERAYAAALALGLPDTYLEAANADFLLDLGRAREVVERLADRGRADVLLLRLTLAAHAVGDRRAKGWATELAARFEAARARGDRTHEKEESRFVLALQRDPARALALAQSNFAVQKEAADARVLLEAALAARQRPAAAPVFEWLEKNRVQSVVLRDLAAKVQALP
jgi:Tfp pilus assembly protein PilF